MKTYCGCDSGVINPDDRIDLIFETDIRPVIDTGGGSSNYDDLSNKPSINGVTLVGNKTNEELLIQAISNEDLELLLK